jgi:nickel transport protein
MDLSTFHRYLARLCFTAVAAGLTSASGVAAAHELEAAVSFAPPAVVIRAAYGGSEPVSFAKVQVFAPSSPGQEFQTGVTDRRGSFSFVPDAPGAWRVVIDDEEGHRREVPITVPESFHTNTGPVPTSASRLERALVGVALIVGATGFLYGFRARRTSVRLPS